MECSMIVNEKRAGLTSYVRRIAPAVDHDNVVGESLLALYQKWDQISGDKLSWLYRVARNKAVDAVRDKDNGHAEIDETAAGTDKAAPLGAWTPPSPGERLLFVEAIGALPRHLGLPLTLFGKGWRVEEIAEYEGLSIETTRTYLARAKKFFSHHLRTDDPDIATRSEGTTR
jgi:DNA-directed RNA polymerase specialized sigma24 family protein